MIRSYLHAAGMKDGPDDVEQGDEIGYIGILKDGWRGWGSVSLGLKGLSMDS